MHWIPERASAAREEMREAVQAHRLAEIRKALGTPAKRTLRPLWASHRPVFRS